LVGDKASIIRYASSGDQWWRQTQAFGLVCGNQAVADCGVLGKRLILVVPEVVGYLE
jgi:hypothetical protein